MAEVGLVQQHASATMTVDLAPSLRAEQVLSNADLVGVITPMLKDHDGGTDAEQELATRAARSLCLASMAVRAAVLASVRRVRMDRPLPAVLQKMASLVSLDVGPGLLDPSQLRQLTRLRAGGISSPQALLAIMQLTRLQELRLDIGADDAKEMMRALQSISSLRSLGSLDISFPKMKELPATIVHLAALSSLNLGGCSSLQQLPDTIGQMASLCSMDLSYCIGLVQLPDTIGQLTALSSLHLGGCDILQQLPDTIGHLTALSSLDLGDCPSVQQLPDSIGQLIGLTSLHLGGCDNLQQLPDTIGGVDITHAVHSARPSTLDPSVITAAGQALAFQLLHARIPG
jgi:hypothetical protein